MKRMNHTDKELNRRARAHRARAGPCAHALEVQILFNSHLVISEGGWHLEVAHQENVSGSFSFPL